MVVRIRHGLPKWGACVTLLATFALVGCGDDDAAAIGDPLSGVSDAVASQLCDSLGELSESDREAEGERQIRTVIESYRQLSDQAEELGAEDFSTLLREAADGLDLALDDDGERLEEGGLRRDVARSQLDLACLERGHPILIR